MAEEDVVIEENMAMAAEVQQYQIDLLVTQIYFEINSECTLEYELKNNENVKA